MNEQFWTGFEKQAALGGILQQGARQLMRPGVAQAARGAVRGGAAGGMAGAIHGVLTADQVNQDPSLVDRIGRGVSHGLMGAVTGGALGGAGGALQHLGATHAGRLDELLARAARGKQAPGGLNGAAKTVA